MRFVHEGGTDDEIAGLLNVEGHRSRFGNTFTADRLAHIRQRRGLLRPFTFLAGHNRTQAQRYEETACLPKPVGGLPDLGAHDNRA